MSEEMMKQNELLEVTKTMCDYIGVLPTDTAAASPVMLGFDQDWTNGAIHEAEFANK